MSKKGISPLIATILLIAFVIAVGGILSGWMISFTKERTDEARLKGEIDITCSYTALYISDADWNDTENKLSLIVENTGSEDLSDFRLSIIYNNGTSKNLMVLPSTTMEPGDVVVFYNQTDVGDCGDISQVFFRSNTCPSDAKDNIEGSDIENCS